MKFSDVIFPDVEDVEGFQALAIAKHGGSSGLRDRGLLESAVMSIQQTFFGEPLHKTLAGMAAALGYGLAKNHAFVDGNKRVAAIATLTFLEVNGYCLRAPEQKWIDLFVRAAGGALANRDEICAAIIELMGQDVEIESDEE